MARDWRTEDRGCWRWVGWRLTISEEDWSTLQHRLAFPLPVVSVRRVEEDNQTGPNKTLK